MTEPSYDDGPPAGEPTPEQYAERARKADKASRGAMAGVLALEAIVILLVPRTIAKVGGLSATDTAICIGLAVVLIAVAGLLRRPWGIAVGSVMQVLFIATGFIIGTMFFVGFVFILIWLRLLMLRHEVVGSPGGLRMLAG
jgi:hypothetical protein